MNVSELEKFKFTKNNNIFFIISILIVVMQIIGRLYQIFSQQDQLVYNRSLFAIGFIVLFLGIMTFRESNVKATKSKKENMFLFNLGLNFIFLGFSVIGRYYGFLLLEIFYLIVALIFATISLLCLIKKL